jgi:hypothetical protein
VDENPNDLWQYLYIWMQKIVAFQYYLRFHQMYNYSLKCMYLMDYTKSVNTKSKLRMSLKAIEDSYSNFMLMLHRMILCNPIDCENGWSNGTKLH